jgi:hypothetical protein
MSVILNTEVRNTDSAAARRRYNEPVACLSNDFFFRFMDSLLIGEAFTEWTSIVLPDLALVLATEEAEQPQWHPANLLREWHIWSSRCA